MKNRIVKSISLFGSLSGIIIFGKILGLIKQMITASAFGATIETDLISLSEGLISNAEYLIGSTLITAFVSVYLHVKSKEEDKADRMVSDSLKFFTLISFAVVCVIFAFSPFFARLIAPTYSGELNERLARYLRAFSPILIPFTLQSICIALLNSNSRFIPGQLIGINKSVILILCVVLLKARIGVYALVVGFFAFSLFNFSFLMICSKKYWSLEKGGPFRNPDVIEVLHLIAPMLLGYSMVFANQLVDKIIVSGMQEGAVTALSYGAVLSNFVTAFIGAFCTVIYTRIAQTYAEGKTDSVARTIDRTTELFCALFLPVTIVSFVFASEIVQIVFGHGAFGAEAVKNCASALKGYCLCFVPYSIKSVYSRALYGNKNTRGPSINTIISIFVNISLSILLYKRFGVFGVAFASSFAEVVCALMNAVSAKRNNSHITLRFRRGHLVLFIFSGILCLFVSYICKKQLMSFSPIERFAVGAALSFAVYALPLVPIIKKSIKEID